MKRYNVDLTIKGIYKTKVTCEDKGEALESARYNAYQADFGMLENVCPWPGKGHKHKITEMEGEFKNYNVELELVGGYNITVEASNEEEALDKAKVTLEKANFGELQNPIVDNRYEINIEEKKEEESK